MVVVKRFFFFAKIQKRIIIAVVWRDKMAININSNGTGITGNKDRGNNCGFALVALITRDKHLSILYQPYQLSRTPRAINVSPMTIKIVYILLLLCCLIVKFNCRTILETNDPFLALTLSCVYVCVQTHSKHTCSLTAIQLHEGK